MKTGYVKHEKKLTLAAAISVPSSPTSAKQWVVIDTLTAEEVALGKTHLSMELGGQLSGPKPTDIRTEWRKAGGTDPTKRHPHVVGVDSSWASAPGANIEDVSAADLPLELVIWQTGGTLKLTKVITKAHNPKAEIVHALGGLVP